ncbi:hypothetical protein [Tepidibacillus marianensis]|uniref:hypothetical protein n=1 Tax=Tepidibacillus marianensis TaxID=3131995 RepID=UPI0030CCAAA2
MVVLKHPSFQSKIHQQFLLWHQGICEYHLNDNSIQALELMNQALNLTASKKDQFTEREIEILNSIGVIYSEISEYENSILYFNQALDHLKYIPYVTDKLIKVRIYYNLAKVLTKAKLYKRSIEICGKGINFCIKFQSFYTLGELYYQKGFNLIQTGNRNEGLEYMKKAIFIFEIQGNQLFIENIQDEINQLLKDK